jgi:hypothetical protein
VSANSRRFLGVPEMQEAFRWCCQSIAGEIMDHCNLKLVIDTVPVKVHCMRDECGGISVRSVAQPERKVYRASDGGSGRFTC